MKLVLAEKTSVAQSIVNNKKVTHHHAIIPTKELQKSNLSELPEGELVILQLMPCISFDTLKGHKKRKKGYII